jgi:NDP-sugar pyrophosphorylase family protein
LIVNADQYIEMSVDDFLKTARQNNLDGLIMTFDSTHPKWSYVRTDENGRAVEAAEKKVISNHATAGLYYFKHGSDFIGATEAMIYKDIRFNNQFYVCPSYNELILEDKKIFIYDISAEKMHGMGTPEDLNAFLNWSQENKIQL